MSELLPTLQARSDPARPARLPRRPRSRWPTRTLATALDGVPRATRRTGIFKGPTCGCGCRSARPTTAGGDALDWYERASRPYGHQAAAFARLTRADLGPEQAASAADAGHHRHRLGQDRGVPLPDPRPRAARQGATASTGHQGADPLPDERARQRPGPAARRADHRRTPSWPASPPASTPASRARRDQGHRRRADHRPRRSCATARRTSCSPTTRCSTSCCCAHEDAKIWAAERDQRCSTSCSTSSTPTTARRAPTWRCCCAGSAWRSRATGRRRPRRDDERPLGRITPVATSATLGDKGDPAAMLDFAETVFGEPFDADAVVTESRLRHRRVGRRRRDAVAEPRRRSPDGAPTLVGGGRRRSRRRWAGPRSRRAVARCRSSGSPLRGGRRGAISRRRSRCRGATR